MKRLMLGVAVCLFAWQIGFVPVLADDESTTDGATHNDGPWITDIDQAMEQAKADGKDLLMNFTGSDWCVWCIRLEDEVFSHDEFQQAIEDKFVLVMLDFPRDTSNMSEELVAQNDEWQSKLEVNGFPSIYLVDAEGRPYAKTGYQEGGVEPYLSHLDELQIIRSGRDEYLAMAEEAEGIEKARLIDQALTMMDESLVTTHYESLIKEIVELDADDEAGLRTKYYAAQDAEMRRLILSRIATAAQTQSPLLAIRTIDSALGEAKLPPDMRVEALQVKLRLLRRLNDQEAVSALLDEMIAIEGIDLETHHRLVVQKIYTMVADGRETEGLNLLNELIATSLDNLYLCVAKGELLDRLGRYEEAVTAFDEAMTGAAEQPELACDILISKSDSLASLEQYEEAFELLDSIVANRRIPDYLKSDVLLHKAMILREIDRVDEARQAEDSSLNFAGSDDERAELIRLIEQLREDD